MKRNYFSYLKFSLRRDMEKKGCAPSERLCIDNNKHTFQIHIGNKPQGASYVASFDNFDDEENVLTCSYGLLNS